MRHTFTYYSNEINRICLIKKFCIMLKFWFYFYLSFYYITNLNFFLP